MVTRNDPSRKYGSLCNADSGTEDHMAVLNWYLPLLVYPRLNGAADDGSNKDIDTTEPSDSVVPLETLLV
jgi:hypothetical protein